MRLFIPYLWVGTSPPHPPPLQPCTTPAVTPGLTPSGSRSTQRGAPMNSRCSLAVMPCRRSGSGGLTRLMARGEILAFSTSSKVTGCEKTRQNRSVSISYHFMAKLFRGGCLFVCLIMHDHSFSTFYQMAFCIYVICASACIYTRNQSNHISSISFYFFSVSHTDAPFTFMNKVTAWQCKTLSSREEIVNFQTEKKHTSQQYKEVSKHRAYGTNITLSWKSSPGHRYQGPFDSTGSMLLPQRGPWVQKITWHSKGEITCMGPVAITSRSPLTSFCQCLPGECGKCFRECRLHEPPSCSYSSYRHI